jgi:lactam utilization protein B
LLVGPWSKRLSRCRGKNRANTDNASQYTQPHGRLYVDVVVANSIANYAAGARLDAPRDKLFLGPATRSEEAAAREHARQNANMGLQVADRAYVLQTGRVALSGAAAELRENELIRHAYLGELKVA